MEEQKNENPKCATNTEIVNTAVDSGKAINGRKTNTATDLKDENINVWARCVCLGSGEL